MIGVGADSVAHTRTGADQAVHTCMILLPAQVVHMDPAQVVQTNPAQVVHTDHDKNHKEKEQETELGHHMDLRRNHTLVCHHTLVFHQSIVDLQLAGATHALNRRRHDMNHALGYRTHLFGALDGHIH